MASGHRSARGGRLLRQACPLAYLAHRPAIRQQKVVIKKDQSIRILGEPSCQPTLKRQIRTRRRRQQNLRSSRPPGTMERLSNVRRAAFAVDHDELVWQAVLAGDLAENPLEQRGTAIRRDRDDQATRCFGHV
jgi:hypothetical protein